MDIRTFEKIFSAKYPISVKKIRLQEKDFSLQQLSIWEKKGWIQNLSRGWRILPKIFQYNGYKAGISNEIYEPSYLSLERALRYHNLIPEGVYMMTACTTKKTQQFVTDIAGTFLYRSIHPRFFWGYDLYPVGDYAHVRIATPEKALCDYIYLHPEISGTEDFEELRINHLLRFDIASNHKLQEYARFYPKSTQKRIQYFLDYITQE